MILKPQVIALAIVMFIGLVPLRWQQCIKLVFVLVVIEGALRKWFLPGASQFLYFGKDFLLLAACVKFLTAKENRRSAVETPPVLRFLLVMSCIFCVLEACNFSLGSPLVGILGARNYLLYIPLMFLVQHLFATQEELARFLRFQVLMGMAVFLLALAQFFSPPESALNTYAWGEEGPQQSLAGNAVRVTGTFSYIAGYASYLQTLASLLVPLLITQHPARWRWIFRVAVVLLVASMFMTGSRGAVIGFVLFLVGFFVFNRLFRQLRLYTRFIIPGILFIIATALWLTPQLHSFMSRASQSEDILPRIVSSFVSPLEYMPHAGAFGYGAGATYQATAIVRRAFNLPPGEKIPIYFEGEPERVMLEFGPIGFLLWYGLRICIIVYLWRTYTRLKFPLLRELALSAFLVHLISLPGQMVFQITFMVYYWFLAGFIFLLPQIEYNESVTWQRQKGSS